MTELIVLLFANISLIFIALSGALLFFYEPDQAKNLKNRILLISCGLLFYTVFIDLLPALLTSRLFSVPTFITLLLLSLLFLFSADFIHRQLLKFRQLKTPLKLDFATSIYIAAMIFAVFGFCIGINFAFGLSSGVLTVTSLSVVAFSKMLYTATHLSKLKIAKHKILKSLAISATTIIPFSLATYLIAKNIPPLRNIVAVLVTGGLLFLAIYAARELFIIYNPDLKRKDKKDDKLD